MTIFDALILFGTVLTIAGFMGLIWCILRIMRARRETEDEVALRDALQSALPLNFGALALSVLGLMCVSIGIILG